METSGLSEEAVSSCEPPVRVVMIGAGNVAWTLAPALDRLPGVEVIQVWSRDIYKSSELASLTVGGSPADTLGAISDDADLYLISVADDAVAKIAASVRCRPSSVAAHTSGGVDASVLSSMTPRYGVFYPLQTFTRGLTVDMGDIPVFVEGSDVSTSKFLYNLARRLSDTPLYADSHKRAVIHAAAVFACNFSNHFLARADDILRREGLGLDILYPLIRETVNKATVIPPSEGQTGPARRGDTECIARHEQLLRPEERELYHLLSESILNYYKKV